MWNMKKVEIRMKTTNVTNINKKTSSDTLFGVANNGGNCEWGTNIGKCISNVSVGVK